jgi:hypothetical protein
VFFELVFVALKVGTTPAMAAFELSFSVIVTVEVAVPFAATGPLPEMVVYAADAAWLNTTVPPVTAAGVTSESVLVSALVDFNVQVETPDAPVAEHDP